MTPYTQFYAFICIIWVCIFACAWRDIRGKRRSSWPRKNSGGVSFKMTLKDTRRNAPYNWNARVK